MVQKNIELLTKDLSCRIPYGVIVNVSGISNVKLTSVSWYGKLALMMVLPIYILFLK